MRRCRGEQVRKGSEGEDVGIKIDKCGKERGKTEEMKLCKSEIQIRSACWGQ